MRFLPIQNIKKRSKFAYPNLSDEEASKRNGGRSTHSEERARIILPKVQNGAEAAKILVLAHGSPGQEHTGTHGKFRHARAKHGDEFPGGASLSFTARGATFPRRCRRRRVVTRGRRSRRLFARARRGSSPMTED